MMVLPAETWMVMSLMFTPSNMARLVRNCSTASPVKSAGSPAMVKVAETTSADTPPGGAGGGEGGGGEGGGGDGGGGCIFVFRFFAPKFFVLLNLGLRFRYA